MNPVFLQDPNHSSEKIKQRLDQSPFTYYGQNLDEQSPFQQKIPVMRQLFFDNDDVEIQNIQQSPQTLFPRITKQFQQYEESLCKKLDFAAGNQRSPILVGGQHMVTEKDDLECDEEQDISNSQSYNIRRTKTCVPIKSDHGNNVCPQCHNNTYKSSPLKEEHLNSHNHPPSFIDQNYLTSQRKASYTKQQQIQFQDSSKQQRHQNLITLKKQNSQILEKKTPQALSKMNSERRRKSSEQKYQTIQKKTRKGSTNQTILSAPKPEVKCNCNKSKCLKLYCDCFAAGQYCGKNCNCCDCSNTETHNHERRSSMKQILDRNPNAFRHKLLSGSEEEVKHFRGCNCKKSNCLKKYCECYQMGVDCSELCKCDDCKNCDSPQKSKKKSKMRSIGQFNSIKEDQQPFKLKRMRIC